MTVEVSRINIPEPTVKVETIAEKRKRPQKGQKRFERIDSGVEGVEIIVEPGEEVDFTNGEVRRLQADTDRIARFRTRHQKIFDAAKSRLVVAANTQKGFRGVVSARGNYEAPLVPTERVVYDSKLLEESTGEFHKTLIREEGRLVIDLPFGSHEDGRALLSDFTQSVARLMIEAGRDPNEVGALITPVIVQRLDEERLNQLIVNEQVMLLPDTKKSTFDWGTPINPIDKMTSPRRQRPLISES